MSWWSMGPQGSNEPQPSVVFVEVPCYEGLPHSNDDEDDVVLLRAQLDDYKRENRQLRARLIEIEAHQLRPR